MVTGASWGCATSTTEKSAKAVAVSFMEADYRITGPREATVAHILVYRFNRPMILPSSLTP